MQRRKTTCALEEGLLEAAELGERGRVPHGAGLNMAVGSENKCMHGQRLACMVLVRGTGAACLPRLPCCTFDCGSGCGGWGMQRGQSDGARGETGPAWGGWLHKCQRAVTEANPSLFIHWSLEGHAGAAQTPHLFLGGMASGCRGAMCGVCRIQTPHFL